MHMRHQSSYYLVMTETQPVTKAGNQALNYLKGLSGEHLVAVGLSGGVDSSLTAAFLVEAGWEVEGLTLWLMSGKGACCSDGLIDAAGICEELGIIHHVVDSRVTFQNEIVQGLVKGYQEGITPLPCSRCNRYVKFQTMLNWAREERSIQRIATGHYARTRNSKDNESSVSLPGDSSGRNRLLRGLDQNKDQSYFLYDLSQDVLERIVFPLGELSKDDTRKEAARYGLRTANKPESQDLCLVDHHGSMSAFLEAYISPRVGKIVLKDGTVIGEHNGIEHFTIGQRKGLGVAWDEPLYVVRLDEINNRVVVAPRNDSGESFCTVGAINWVSIAPPSEPIVVEVQIRYRSQPAKAKLTPIKVTDSDIQNERPYRCLLNFEEEQFSITPGQAAVFYSGDVVLGGGLIQRFENT